MIHGYDWKFLRTNILCNDKKESMKIYIHALFSAFFSFAFKVTTLSEIINRFILERDVNCKYKEQSFIIIFLFKLFFFKVWVIVLVICSHYMYNICWMSVMTNNKRLFFFSIFHLYIIFLFNVLICTSFNSGIIP